MKLNYRRRAGGPGRAGFTLLELLVVIFIIAIVASILIPTVHRTRHGEGSGRVKCGSNLRQIGQAILLYANENKGAYPRTIFDVKNPAPTWGTPYEGSEKLGALPKEKVDPFDPKKSEVVPKPNDVTAALFKIGRASCRE